MSPKFIMSDVDFHSILARHFIYTELSHTAAGARFACEHTFETIQAVFACNRCHSLTCAHVVDAIRDRQDMPFLNAHPEVVDPNQYWYTYLAFSKNNSLITVTLGTPDSMGCRLVYLDLSLRYGQNDFCLGYWLPGQGRAELMDLVAGAAPEVHDIIWCQNTSCCQTYHKYSPVSNSGIVNLASLLNTGECQFCLNERRRGTTLAEGIPEDLIPNV